MKKMITFFSNNAMIMRKISTNFNALTGLYKVVLAIFSNSLLLVIYSFYNVSMSLAKRTSIRSNLNHKYENYYFCGIIVLISSITYVLYSNYIYFNGSNANYHMITAIGIATLSFFNITVAIIGTVQARKNKDISKETLKLTNLASSLISISLTQTALLSFALEGDSSKYSAIGGIVFGLLASIVGIYMIFYTIKMKERER